MRTILQLCWHLIRYISATTISTLVSAMAPLLIASVPLLLAIVWVLLWSLAFLIYLLTGEMIEVEIDEPIGLILIPLLLTLMGVVTISAAILLTTAFNLFIVLPFSLITEAIYGRLVGKRPIIRLGIFLGAGIILGVIVAATGVIWMVSQQSGLSLSYQVGLAVFLFIICICTEFAFGLTLTLLDGARKGIVVARDAVLLGSSNGSDQSPI